MAIHKSLTTVTPLSKMLALILFILLPFIGFYGGIWYSKKTNTPLIASDVVVKPTTVPKLDSSSWKEVPSKICNVTFRVPPAEEPYIKVIKNPTNTITYRWEFPRGAVNPPILSLLEQDQGQFPQPIAMFVNEQDQGSGDVSSAVYVLCRKNNPVKLQENLPELIRDKVNEYNIAEQKSGLTYTLNKITPSTHWEQKGYDVSYTTNYENSGGLSYKREENSFIFIKNGQIFAVGKTGQTKDAFVQRTADEILNTIKFR